MPALQAAEEALQVLDKKDLDEMKAMKSPGQVIRNVLRALCLILYPNPTEKMKAPDGIRFVTDWWQASLKVLGRPNLKEVLMQFDRDNIDEKIIKNLGAYLTDPEFKDTLEENVVANASGPCKCIIMWIRGIYNYYFVNKRVKPKKIALGES